MTVQPATLARGPGRPASLYLARSKSISSSNPDLAVAPGSVDDEVSRILASKVGRGGPRRLRPQWPWLPGGWVRDFSVGGGQETADGGMDTGWTLGRRGSVAVTGGELGLEFTLGSILWG